MSTTSTRGAFDEAEVPVVEPWDDLNMALFGRDRADVIEAIADEARHSTGGTPEEWLATIEIRTEREKREESSERRRLLYAVARAMHPQNESRYPVVLASRIGSPARRMEAFNDWMQREGEAMFRAWLDVGLTRIADDMEFIRNGVCFGRYFKGIRKRERASEELAGDDKAIADYCAHVEQRGRRLLIKGYLGGRFEEDEIADLRLYGMWVDCRCCGGGVLPFDQDLAKARPWRGKGTLRPMAGEPAPDFTMPAMQTLLDSPRYTDENEHDPSDVLRPMIVKEFLQLMRGYEPAEPDPARPMMRVRAKAVEDLGPDPVSLGSLRGTPQLLAFINPTDTWCWHGKLAPMLQPLAQACAGRIGFHLVNTTIHDTVMPVYDFLAAEPGVHVAPHDLSLEQRARTCRMFYLNFPNVNLPYLLDDMAQHARNAYCDQGGGAYLVLVDADGVVAYCDYHQLIPPHWGESPSSFPEEFLHLRMNLLESRIAAFLAGGCRYDPAMEATMPAWRRPPLEDLRLRRVEGGRLTLVMADGQLVSLAVDDQTRVVVDGRRADVRGLQVGDDLRVSFDHASTVARFILKRSDGWRDSWKDGNDTIWIAAEIGDCDGTAIDIRPMLPEAAEMRGLRFWAEAGVTPFHEPTRLRLEETRRLDQQRGEPRRFGIDRAVDVWINGEAALPADLRPGDVAGVEYICDADPRLALLRMRIYRFGA